MNELLGKHTAVLGATGAGKSGAVAAIVHSILDRGAVAGHANWKPQIVVLDPHNEYMEKRSRTTRDSRRMRALFPCPIGCWT